LLLQRIDSQFPWSNDEDEFNEKEEKEVVMMANELTSSQKRARSKPAWVKSKEHPENDPIEVEGILRLIFCGTVLGMQ
jgi:acyl-CoA thioesterase